MTFLVTATRNGATLTRRFASLADAEACLDALEASGWGEMTVVIVEGE